MILQYKKTRMMMEMCSPAQHRVEVEFLVIMIGERGVKMEEQEQEMRCVKAHGAGALAELICVMFLQKYS